jgi:hypothetical protein
MKRTTQTVPLPANDAPPSRHTAYAPGQTSDCPRHSLCAYTGTEEDRCAACHSTLTAHTPSELARCEKRLAQAPTDDDPDDA